METLDPIIRTSACTLLVFLALARTASNPRSLREWLLAALLVGIAAFAAGNRITPGTLAFETAGVTTILDGAAVMVVPAFWLFSLSIFQPAFRLMGWHGAAVLVWTLVSASAKGWLGTGSERLFPDQLILLVVVAVVGHVAWALWRGWDGDLLDGRRQSRAWVTVVLATLLSLDVLADALMGTGWRPSAFATAQNVIVLGFAVMACSFGLTVRPLWRPALPETTKTQLSRAARRVLDAMQEEQAYLDSGLRLAAFARSLGLSQHVVRHAIREDLGHGHFTVFVNGYRVQHAKMILEDPGRTNDKVISVALESGFNSLSSFQRVFKGTTGMTAHQWRQRHRRQQSSSI